MKKILLWLSMFVLSLNLMAQGIKGDWWGTIEINGIKLRLVFHISQAEGKYSATMDSPDQGAKGIPVSSVAFENDSLTIQIAHIGAVYQGRYQADKITGIFTQVNTPMPLELKRGDGRRNRPQEPKSPVPYVCEEVTFVNPEAGITLAGTLTLPRKDGKFPAVVLISGSGPQNRDEELMGHKPFLVIADYLTRHGIAVLRFDDRGTAQSGGKFLGATSRDFATDVVAAFQYLQKREDIESSAIGLIGHSEGGMIAPMVAVSHPDVAFIVLLAGTGVSGREILVRQTEDLLRGGGTSEEKIQKILTLNQAAMDIVVQNSSAHAFELLETLYMDNISILADGKELTPEEQKQLAQETASHMAQPWMYYFINYDPAPVLEKVKCPVLALNGEKDVQVNDRLNLGGIRKSLEKGGNKQIKIIAMPGLNHLFQHCQTGMVDEYAALTETFSPEVLKIISDWIEGVVNNRK